MTEFAHDVPGTAADTWRAHHRWPGSQSLDLTATTPPERVVVVAAHPDDESLGAAGLVSRVRRLGVPVELVVVTAGEHSHPASPTVSPAALGVRRRRESLVAWDELGATGAPVFLDVEDGTVAAAEDEVTRRLVDVVGDGRHTLLLAPWRHDGHPDHEAAGRAAAATARRTGADLLEYPVWFWHWARPEDGPWDELVAVELDAEDERRKQRAIGAHVSQLAPLSPEPGDERLLGPDLLAHFAGPVEVFVRAAAVDGALDRLHSRVEEPWDVDQRWYEQRKRDLTLAVLPRRRFAHALEVGCSTGALAAALAERCDQVTAVDSSAAAVDRAIARLRDLDGVRVVLADLPAEWPGATYDLVVLSEVGYFLSPADLDRLAERMYAALAPDGVVVLCHWRHDVAGWVLDGPEVHRRLVARSSLPVAARYTDRDVEIVLLAAPDQVPDPTA